MTYKQLLEKNARAKARREMLKAIQEAEVNVTPVIVEETPHVEVVESEKDEVKEEDVAIVVEAPKKKRKSSKPKNREYMVVENIDEVNKD